MADYEAVLIKLTQNLNTLREREARYGGNAPLELVNQIADHEQATTLTEQVIHGDISETGWREALRPLLGAIDSRSGEAVGKYLLTNAEYRRFIEAGGYQNKRWWTKVGWQTKEIEKWIGPGFW